MPAACRSSCRAKQHRHRGQLRPAGDQPRELAAGRARDRRAFDRHVQRRFVVPLPRDQARSSAAVRHADRRRPARCARSTREDQPTAPSCCAPRMTATRADFGVIHQRALHACRRRPPARRRGQFHARPRGDALPDAAATNSPSASTCIPRSRPTGCPTATASCCCCRTRRCGPSMPTRTGRARGKRLSGRHGRAAPHRADRDLRPRPRNVGGALDLLPHAAGAARRRAPSGREEPELPL